MKTYVSLGLLISAFVVMSSITAQARNAKTAAYDGMIDFGPQLLYLDDGCVSIDGTVAAGGFFGDLERIETGSWPEFIKDGRVVTDYPESLTASIRLVGSPCEVGVSDSLPTLLKGDSYSLTFEVAWKDGMQMRPAEFSPAAARCVGSRVLTNPAKGLSFPEITCQITVVSRGVPLANHLIVSIFTSDGKRLTRLSASP
jgi:hypothetical protein